MESARYQEQVTDTPQYRPFTNPNLQSNSFKTLQTVIDSGRGRKIIAQLSYRVLASGTVVPICLGSTCACTIMLYCGDA